MSATLKDPKTRQLKGEERDFCRAFWREAGKKASAGGKMVGRSSKKRPQSLSISRRGGNIRSRSAKSPRSAKNNKGGRRGRGILVYVDRPHNLYLKYEQSDRQRAPSGKSQTAKTEGWKPYSTNRSLEFRRPDLVGRSSTVL